MVNLSTIIDTHPDSAPALVHQRDRISYGQLRSAVGRARGALVGLGLEPGDRIGLLVGTTPRFVVAYLAALGAGMVVVPLNPHSPVPELGRQLDVVAPRALVVGARAAATVAELRAGAGLAVEHVVVPRGVDLDGAVCLDDVDGADSAVVDRAGDDVAVLMFTSGTAGSPKPAMLTHRSLRANLDQMAATNRRLDADDVVLCPLPLFHIHGLNATVGPALAAGASLVLMERFDPVEALDTVVAEGVTVVSGPPTLWSALTAAAHEPTAMAGVRMGLSGGAALAPAVRAAVEDRFGVRISEGYGLTESGSVLTVGDEDTPSGSVGRPLPGVTLRLVDETGDDVLVGDVGEVWATGANVFAGYWGDDDATERVLGPDGWLRTGDLAVVGDDGQLRIVDRAKDLIVVSGFNVFPAEVEEVLALHPAVADVGVSGVDHPHQGEAVRAHVVAAVGHEVDVDDVIEHCRRHLPGYKCPTSVVVVDEIPRTVTGKVRRSRLERGGAGSA